MAETSTKADDARNRDPTYHTTDATYALPNDAVEYDRLEDQATGLAELMHNKFIHAPLREPQQIVDVGCGTGIVTRQLGTMYPTAQVYGIDLSPVPAGQDPPNVEYVLGNVRKLLDDDERLAHGSTDYVFSRLLILGMSDWPGYVKDMAALVRSGGWVEMQDLVLEVYLNGDLVSNNWGWSEAITTAAQRRDWDFKAGRNIKDYMERAGLVDIEVKEYRMPLGTWLVDEQPETRRIGEHAAREYGMLYYHAIPKMLNAMGFSDAKIGEFQKACLDDLAAQDGKEAKFFVTIGRKP